MEIRAQTHRTVDSEAAKMREVLTFLREMKAGKQDDSFAPAVARVNASAPPASATALFSRERVVLPAGEVLPKGDMAARFQKLAPAALRDFAPEGMELPLDAGYNNRPTSDASTVASNRLRLAAATASLGGDLTYKLFNHFLGNTGGTQELPTRDSNMIRETLAHRSSSFMRAHVEQIKGDIQEQIDVTGQTSGRLHGTTDWTTTNVESYQNSLGLFSAKLVYDVQYAQNLDGTIELSGNMAVAIQDLYDFGDEQLITPIPANALPADFRNREGFTTPDGRMTDRALGALQREGLAKPFYVMGMSDSVQIDIELYPRSNASRWNVGN